MILRVILAATQVSSCLTLGYQVLYPNNSLILAWPCEVLRPTVPPNDHLNYQGGRADVE